MIEYPPLRDRVKLLQPSDLKWGFDGKCSAHIPVTADKWENIYNVDPFPCYSHNLELVREIAALCEKRFPTKFPTVYGILPAEDESRTNGQASKEYTHYDRATEKSDYIGVITLFGKRIPLHPAMTRYLVAHEYGHIADYHLCFVRNLKDDGLDEEYARVRGIEHNSKYGGGNWHTNIGEVIANDFRISVCGIEREFWPHPYPHPDEVPAVGEWWSEMMLKYCEPPRRDN